MPWPACINAQYTIIIKLLVLLLEEILEVLIALCILKPNVIIIEVSGSITMNYLN